MRERHAFTPFTFFISAFKKYGCVGPLFGISKLFSLLCQLLENTVMTKVPQEGSRRKQVTMEDLPPKDGEQRAQPVLWGPVPFQSAKAFRSFLLSCPQVGDSLGSTNLLQLTAASPRQRWTIAATCHFRFFYGPLKELHIHLSTPGLCKLPLSTCGQE